MQEKLKNIDVTSSQYKTILSLLKKYLPDVEAWAYGSRVKWTSKPQSDLDMVVFASKGQQLAVSNLKEALEESDLPFTVDLFIWDDVPEQFHNNIKKEHVVLQKTDMENPIPSEWKEYKLSEIIEIIGGGTPKTSCAEYWNGNIPWLSVVDFNSDDRRVSKTEKAITELGLQKSSTKILKKNEIIISARGTVGALAQLATDMAFNQSCYGIKAKDNITINDFIYYLLKFSINELKSKTHGSVFSTITRETFDYIQINLPPLPEQQAIAEILGSLDDKIELNRQMNKTLEEMAQAIFKSWFVDFDPVKAKSEGRSIDGMPQEIMELFPDEFEESELGLIPKGWRVSSLADITSYLNRGVSPKYTETDGVLVINQRCIRENRINCENARRHDTSKRKIEGKLLELGDVLVNSTGVGTLGRVAQVDYLDEESIVDSHVTVVRANEKFINKMFLGFELIRRQTEIEALGEGSTGQTELSRKRLGDLILLTPSLSLQNIFNQIITPTKNKIIISEKENKNLSILRDSLLPKLISGQIRVNEAKNLVEGVL